MTRATVRREVPGIWRWEVRSVRAFGRQPWGLAATHAEAVAAACEALWQLAALDRERARVAAVRAARRAQCHGQRGGQGHPVDREQGHRCRRWLRRLSRRS